MAYQRRSERAENIDRTKSVGASDQRPELGVRHPARHDRPWQSGGIDRTEETLSSFSSGLPDALRAAGPLLGFLISLAIGSYLIRDNFLARLAQYVLVGAGLGYLAVLVWRNVLWPRLFAPLVADPLSWLSLTGAGLLPKPVAAPAGLVDVGRRRGSVVQTAPKAQLAP